MGSMIEMPADRINARQVAMVTDLILGGGVAVIPTDSSYALVCAIGNGDAIDRIRVLRQLDQKHHFTLLCADLTKLASYAEVSNPVFRFIKARIPGPYTFILKATKAVPNRLKQAKRKTIGLRVTNHPVTQAILSQLEDGILSVSLSPSFSQDDYHEIIQSIKDKVDIVIDSGPLNSQTTVVDYSGDTPLCLREGAGVIDW